MGRIRWIGVGLLLAGAADCGYPDFQFTSGAGSAGGTSSSGSSSGSSGGPCQLVGSKGCPSGQRCTIVAPTTGTVGCVAEAAMPLHPYDACTSDTLCPMGTWCNGRTEVCMPFCTSSADCQGNDCIGADDASGNTVPGGASVCVANCNPETASPCGNGATCAYDSSNGAMDCFLSSNYCLGQSCKNVWDCSPGLVCAGMCVIWCDVKTMDCPLGTCTMFSNIDPMYDGDVYGYCQ
jgi:hypothetical protein